MSDRYEIRKKIGQGGIGAVYKAFDTRLQRNVALKRLLPLAKTRENADAASALEKEASIISSLQNPNVVTVFDTGTDDEGVFVVMELIEGQTLDRIVKRAALQQGDFISVVEQSLGGLIAAQDAGLLHRDLKPKNIMVSWLPSGSFQLKILDFGLAKFSVKPSLQTVDHGDNILGSIHFMAPEQFERKHLDPRTDLYAIGCVYYFALAQRYPFRGETPGEVMNSHLNHFVKPLEKIRKDLNPAYCDWIMRLISREPGDRPADARAALEEFQAIETAPVAKLAQPVTAAPIAVTIPEIDAANTTSFVGPTGPVTALQRASLPSGSEPVSKLNTVAVPAPASSRRKFLIFGGLALIPAAALIAFAAFRSRTDPGPDLRPGIPPLPLSANRVAHYAAHTGVFSGNGGVIAAKRERVSRWSDLAGDVGGINALEQLSENDKLKPTYETASKESGLNGSHPVLRFRKGESLIALRGSGEVVAGFGEALDELQLTWFIVFKPVANAGDHRILSMDQQGFPNARVTQYRQKAFQSGVRQRGVPDRLSSSPCNLGSFILLTFLWDGIKGEQFQTITIPDGTRIPGAIEETPAKRAQINRFRLGAAKAAKIKPVDLFAGDVAELIIYNQALSKKDLKIVENYLYKKYFGF